ncbi:MAG: S1C family serine protease [Solirubrobacteraceae bacterium]
MNGKRLFLIPFVSAVAGGALVAVVIAAAGGLGSSTKTITRVESSPIVPSSANASQQNVGLSAHAIYERTAPGVVFVASTVVRHSESPFEFFRGEGTQQGTDTGSGIVIDANGTILTNWHVVENAVKVTVSLGENSRAIEAKVVGKDPSKDIAVLRIPTEGVTLHPIKLGNSSAVQVGEPVLAIGNPFDLERTLTTGVVSALQRQIQAPNGFAITNVIQTDAPINPGNSGGPLLNTRGEVIGINSQIETAGTNGNIGIGFAIPINTAKTELPELEKGQTVSEGYLGVETVSVNGSLSVPGLNLPVKEGALVESVQQGTPAEKAGIHGGDVEAHIGGSAVEIGGDIITGIDGKPVKSSEDLASAITTKKAGQTVSIELWHATGNGGGYQKKTVQVTLANRPATLHTSQGSSPGGGGEVTPEG